MRLRGWSTINKPPVILFQGGNLVGKRLLGASWVGLTHCGDPETPSAAAACLEPHPTTTSVEVLCSSPRRCSHDLNGNGTLCSQGIVVSDFAQSLASTNVVMAINL